MPDIMSMLPPLLPHKGGPLPANAKKLATTGEHLMTAQEAAAKLGMSVKTLVAHVGGGRLRFVNIGTAKRRQLRFTEKNLQTFIENQKVREVPPCQSISKKTPHTTATISSSKVVAFSALQKPGTKKTPFVSKGK